MFDFEIQDKIQTLVSSVPEKGRQSPLNKIRSMIIPSKAHSSAKYETSMGSRKNSVDLVYILWCNVNTLFVNFNGFCKIFLR